MKVSHLNNYRPFALASILSKVLEENHAPRINVFVDSSDIQVGLKLFVKLKQRGGGTLIHCEDLFLLVYQ